MSTDIENVTITQRIGYEDIGTITEDGIKKWLGHNLGRFVADNLEELPITYSREEEREGIKKKIKVNIISDRLYSYIKRNEKDIMEKLEEDKKETVFYDSEEVWEIINKLTKKEKE